MRTLITGTAGFIGNAVALRLLEAGDEILGIDNINDYYDVSLKQARLARLTPFDRYQHSHMDLESNEALLQLFNDFKPHRVIHLAAQAGVRYSLLNPHAYIASNITGFLNVLEACVRHPVQHLVYASSSSVYGANTSTPSSVQDRVDHPMSLYAASKKANELMAHTYSHLHNLPTTGLRFFTVYGPWGRPDMSPHIFTRKIFAGEPVDLYNFGNHARDFTYIDDVVEGVIRVSERVAAPNITWSGLDPDPSSSNAPYKVYNIGSNNPVTLKRYIEILEECIEIKAAVNLLPLQPGDVLNTFADVEDLMTDINYRPITPIEVGLLKFVKWYRDYYNP